MKDADPSRHGLVLLSEVYDCTSFKVAIDIVGGGNGECTLKIKRSTRGFKRPG